MFLGGFYLDGTLALDAALYPLQPVRVLLLPDPLIHLGAQLLGSLQSFSQGPAVRMPLWSVLQDLTNRKLKGHRWRGTWNQSMNISNKVVDGDFCR